MAKAWSAWLPDVLVVAPSCPGLLAQHEIKRAAQDFFERGRAWRAALDPIAIDPGEPEMRILPDNNATEIVRIEFAAFGAESLECLPIENLPSQYGADWASQTGTPGAVSAMTALTVRLVPYPVEAPSEQLSLTVSLKPAETATGIPDDLYSKYREQIATGAKSRLLQIPDKPWTSFDLGAALAARFEHQIDVARSAAERAFGRGRMPSKPVWC